jgi:hypothetical protein
MAGRFTPWRAFAQPCLKRFSIFWLMKNYDLFTHLNLPPMKKIAPFFACLALVSLSGCVTNSHESGKRTNILFGLVDYKNNYRSSGYVYDPVDAGVFNNSVISTKPTSSAYGYNQSVDGKQLSILWGLGGTYNWQ